MSKKQWRTTKGHIDLGETYLQAHHKRTPVIHAEDRRKYCTVVWNCDGMYPYKLNNDSMEELTEIVKRYSLDSACYGIAHGTINKVRIEDSDELMGELEKFVIGNIEPAPWP